MTTRWRFAGPDLSLVLVSIIWGGNYSISKLAIGHLSPVVFAALRFVLSTALLWLMVSWFRLAKPLPPATRWKLLAWGIVGHTLNQITFLSGLRLTSATNSALIFSNLPVAVALLGMVTGAERPRLRAWLGIALGTLGVSLVVAARGVHFGPDTVRGDLLSVAGLLCWAIFTVGLRHSALGVHSAQVTALTHLGGTPGLLLAAAPGLVATRLDALHPTVWLGLAYSSVLASVVAAVLWTRSLKALGGSRTALYNCLTPLFAGAVAWVVLGERPVALQGLGAIFVLVGIVVGGRTN